MHNKTNHNRPQKVRTGLANARLCWQRYVSKRIYMRQIKIFICSLLCSLLMGCSSINTPSSSLINSKPVITIGTKKTPPKDHILYIPANQNFPLVFSVNGDLFSESKTAKVMVSFKKNLYLYKSWASLNGKDWVNSHKLLNVVPSGGFDSSGGKVEIKLNFAK